MYCSFKTPFILVKLIVVLIFFDEVVAAAADAAAAAFVDISFSYIIN